MGWAALALQPNARLAIWPSTHAACSIADARPPTQIAESNPAPGGGPYFVAHSGLIPKGELAFPLAWLQSAKHRIIRTIGKLGFRGDKQRAADEALMALVVDGDRDAFALLYERHCGAATMLAMRMCPRRVIAEEVVQDAFLACWRGRRLFDRRRGSVRGWMLGIVRNRAIDVLRQSPANQLLDLDAWNEVETSQALELEELDVGRRDSARELLTALYELPPEQSRVITLAYYGGYTHAEIATMLDTPIGTVKGRVRLGLRKMAAGVTAPI
jgi:RNA polymerase sigma-70 factor, ECF subfamily